MTGLTGSPCKILWWVACVSVVFSSDVFGQDSLDDQFPEELEVLQEVELEESQDVINVYPRATVDVDGNLVITDLREGQVRLYSQAGNLKSYFGSIGGGPGQFRQPMGTARLPNGEFLVADIDGRLHKFSEDGTFINQYRTPLARLLSVFPAGATKVVLGGYRAGGRPGQDLVHVWDLETQTLGPSFYQAPMHENYPRSVHAAAGGWISAAVKNDTVAVTFSVSDSIKFYSLDGHLLDVKEIPSRHFIFPSKPPPDPNSGSGNIRLRLQEWIGSFTRISDLHWAGEVLYLVYSQMDSQTPNWHLLAMCRRGERVFDTKDLTRLLTTLPNLQLVFLSPNSLAPNKVVQASLRQNRCE